MLLLLSYYELLYKYVLLNVIDSYFYNVEAQKVKSIFQIRKGFLRSYKLNELLHYSTYQNTNINVNENIIKLYKIT